MSEPERVHVMTLLPGDRFQVELDGPVYQIEFSGRTYKARTPDGQLVTLTSLMGKQGLRVLPVHPAGGGR